MNSSDPQPEDKSRVVILRRAQQPLIAITIAGCLIAIAWFYLANGLRQGRMIDIDQAAPLRSNFKVNINTAAWPEMVVLPGIGEATARDIVAERQRAGPFTDLEDIARRVHGVGPRLLEQIEPYLLPMDGSNDEPAH
jgi:competence ComEA-like helix-hairpin-helix protein